MLMDMELKIAVVDDQDTDRGMITRMAEAYLRENGVPHKISCYPSGEALLEEIRCGKKFNLLLLDVMMGEMNGMDLAAELRRQHNKCAIIFISSNREMALRGYEVAALRYLAKPLEEDKFREALGFCCRAWQEKKEILLPTERGQHRISYSDIYFVEAFDRGTRFVLANETIDTRLKFSEAQSMLPKTAFILCHRAYIANVANVRRIRNNEFEMSSGIHVPISKHRYAEVSRRFFDYISD